MNFDQWILISEFWSVNPDQQMVISELQWIKLWWSSELGYDWAVSYDQWSVIHVHSATISLCWGLLQVEDVPPHQQLSYPGMWRRWNSRMGVVCSGWTWDQAVSAGGCASTGYREWPGTSVGLGRGTCCVCVCVWGGGGGGGRGGGGWDGGWVGVEVGIREKEDVEASMECCWLNNV